MCSLCHSVVWTLVSIAYVLISRFPFAVQDFGNDIAVGHRAGHGNIAVNCEVIAQGHMSWHEAHIAAVLLFTDFLIDHHPRISSAVHEATMPKAVCNYCRRCVVPHWDSVHCAEGRKKGVSVRWVRCPSARSEKGVNDACVLVDQNDNKGIWRTPVNLMEREQAEEMFVCDQFRIQPECHRKRGANSFTISTAMACLELTNKLVQTVQGVAELAYDMLSPGPSMHIEAQNRRHRAIPNKLPVDIRDGVNNAYQVVAEGLGDTARTLVKAASQEHRQKGVSGAVGGLLRQLPPSMAAGIIVATEATSTVLGGVRNQIQPDARREDIQKWRQRQPPKSTGATSTTSALALAAGRW
ncbi:hypothetical protein HPB51_003759 [Rhipicephalus microplus]|uniref:Autophagy-related protein 2 n=1 Tax=Rhipicephalus microplus TaxID=6941 RepID=A0A9J6DZ35_RHIMP|nr:hypothetical protein HPB51_003759 [Rhipicephalus microplus]